MRMSQWATGGVVAVLVLSFDGSDDGVLDGVGGEVGVAGDAEGVAVEGVELVGELRGVECHGPIQVVRFK